jgi:outer membrane receptor for Fe3+-dicitrate
MGDRELHSQSLTYKSILDFDEIQTGNLEHSIKAGIEAEFGKAKYKSEEGGGFMGGDLNSSAVGDKDDGIITGEQSANWNQIRMPIDNKQSYTQAALFLEDTININRYTIRPGIRLSTKQ